MMRTFMRAFLCCLVMVCVLALNAQYRQSGNVVSRVQIHITPENADRVHLMELDLTHGHYVPGKAYVSDLYPWQIEHVRNLGFEVDVLIEDVVSHHQTHQSQRSPAPCDDYNYTYRIPVNFAHGSMGGYLTYSEILDALDLMWHTYPDLVSAREKTGDEETYQGRPIYWVRLSDNADTDEAEPEVLYTGLHHAREPMSMMQMIYYMWYLLEGYGKDPEATYLLNNTELYFIPCVNPDGYIYNQITNPNGDGMWRKNMRDNDDDGEFDEREDGVDLNRNYGYQWGLDNEGSSGNTSAETYRGPAPFSEPETRAIKEFVEQRDIFIALNYHAYGNYFIYPWGYTDDLNPDLIRFQNYGELMGLDNGFEHGTSTETVGYPTNGSSDDWMYAEHDIYAMTPELGEDFWPEESLIIPLSQASLMNNIALAHLPHQYAITTEINGAFFTERQGTLDIFIKSYGEEFGDMALTVVSLSPELNIDGNIFEVSIETFEDETYSVEYTLDPSAQGGDEFSFIILLDNGFFEVRDTMTKTLAGETLVFYEDGDDVSDWITAGTTWNSTDEEAYVGSTCITDSPGDTYGANEESVIQISEPIDLRDAIHAVLEFWTKWEIEELIDYAQVQISIDGINFDPLCGDHTKPGSIFQPPDQPIYDGVQEEWVKETMDLSAYIGSEVSIRFLVYSDSLGLFDGLYLDEIRVYVYDEGITGTEDPTHATLRIWPNPVSDQLWVSTEGVNSTYYAQWISVTNAIGTEVFTLPLNTPTETHRINTSSWTSGLYFVNVFTDGRISETHKIVVE